MPSRPAVRYYAVEATAIFMPSMVDERAYTICHMVHGGDARNQAKVPRSRHDDKDAPAES